MLTAHSAYKNHSNIFTSLKSQGNYKLLASFGSAAYKTGGRSTGIESEKIMYLPPLLTNHISTDLMAAKLFSVVEPVETTINTFSTIKSYGFTLTGLTNETAMRYFKRYCNLHKKHSQRRSDQTVVKFIEICKVVEPVETTINALSSMSYVQNTRSFRMKIKSSFSYGSKI